MSHSASIQPFVRRLLMHSPLLPEDQALILGLAARRVEANAKSEFARPRDPAGCAWLVCSGMVGETLITASGARQITNVFLPGEAADLHVAAQPRRTTGLVAFTRSVLLRIDRADLRELAFTNAAVAEAFWLHNAIEAAAAAHRIANVGRHDAMTRLAHFLCDIAVRMGGGTPCLDFALPMTQDQLGDATGLTPVHVNRMLSALRRADLLTLALRRVRIADWDRLVDAVGFDPTYRHGSRAAPEAARACV